MDKFYVGAKVVCIKSHSEGYTVKGKVYEVQGVSKFNCLCKDLVLDLGNTVRGNMKCSYCGTCRINTNGILWEGSHRFRLLEPEAELSEFEVNELLDQINESQFLTLKDVV